MTVQEGMTLTLNCSCEGDTVWKHDNEDITDNATMTMDGSGSGGLYSYQLVLSDVSLSKHNGTYYCIDNEDNSTCQNFTVIILGKKNLK